MSGRRARCPVPDRVRRPVSNTAETVVPIAANATGPVPHSKILLLGAFAASLVVGAVPILLRAEMPSVRADSTLKCYDIAGKFEPCVAQASAPPARLSSRTAGAPQPASWTTTAPDQQESWATTVVDQPTNWNTSRPAAPRSGTRRKRSASAICRRRLIPCVLSALRRGLHISHLLRQSWGRLDHPGNARKDTHQQTFS